MKTKKINVISRLGLGLAAGIASLVGGLNTAAARSPRVYVESALVSDYVAPHGMFLEGSVNQNLLNVSLKNGLSGFVWQNHDLGTNSTNEVDVGVRYDRKLNENLTLSAGFQRFNYFWDEFGEFDNVAKAGMNYSNRAFDFKYDMTHMFGHDDSHTGTRHCFRLSKTLDLGKLDDVKISMTPYLGTAFANDYYACRGSPSQITYGLNLNASRGPWSMNVFVNNQDGKVFEDKVWGGVSIGYAFGGK